MKKLKKVLLHIAAIIVHFVLVVMVLPVLNLFAFVALTLLAICFKGGMYGSIEAFNLFNVLFLKEVQDLLKNSFSRGPGGELFKKNLDI